MKFDKTFTALIGLIGIIMLSDVFAGSDVQKQTLPRSFGQVILGMTDGEFRKITNIIPEACAHCANNVLMADLYIDDYPGVFPKREVSLLSKLFNSKNSHAAEFGFFQGKLYRIDLPRDKKNINVVRKEYSEKYGPITVVDNWKNGVSWLIWKNSTTVLTVAYIREKNNLSSFGYYQSVGDIISIQYLDKILRKRLEMQEKKQPSRPVH